MQLASGTVKKVTLELGGKSANIVLDDADLDMAIDGSLFGSFFHQGQVCESGTRLLRVRREVTTSSWRGSSSAPSRSTSATRWT